MKVRKAVLKVETSKQALDRAFRVMKTRSRKHKDEYIISFPDFATLGKVLTGSRLEILAAIRKERPASIQQLAKIVERDFKNVYADVKFLEEFGLIDLNNRGARKASAPTVNFEELVLAA